MPELPEVENIRRTLWPHLRGRPFLAVRVLESRLPQNVSADQLERRLTGRTPAYLHRRGKYLLLGLEGGGGVVFHLRMSGQLLVVFDREDEETVHPYTRMVCTLPRGRLELRDQRRFATAHWADDFEALPNLRRLGPEPLQPGFTPGALADRLSRKRTAIKAALLDQSCVAGLGNIYADEALFRAGIHPLTPARSLGERAIGVLRDAIVEVLQEAVARGGTTIRDYRNGAGQRGQFQMSLRVYGRGGQPCMVCGAPIERVRVAGRSSWYCRRCQPL